MAAALCNTRPAPPGLRVLARFAEVPRNLARADRAKLAHAIRQTVSSITIGVRDAKSGDIVYRELYGELMFHEAFGQRPITIPDEVIGQRRVWREIGELARASRRPIRLEGVGRLIDSNDPSLACYHMRQAVKAGMVRKVGAKDGWVATGQMQKKGGSRYLKTGPVCRDRSACDNLSGDPMGSSPKPTNRDLARKPEHRCVPDFDARRFRVRPSMIRSECPFAAGSSHACVLFSGPPYRSTNGAPTGDASRSIAKYTPFASSFPAVVCFAGNRTRVGRSKAGRCLESRRITRLSPTRRDGGPRAKVRQGIVAESFGGNGNGTIGSKALARNCLTPDGERK